MKFDKVFFFYNFIKGIKGYKVVSHGCPASFLFSFFGGFFELIEGCRFFSSSVFCHPELLSWINHTVY